MATDLRTLMMKMPPNQSYLVDFRGSGGSSGNTTTIGYQESEDVVTAVRYLQRQQVQNLYLLGTSMGSAAILKALSEESLEVQGLILECPYGSLLQTAKNRFETVGVPSFPAAHFLVLYGGLENGFWGFSHNPSAYSQSVETRTLLIFGEQDNRVKRFEIDEIYHNLKGEKELLIFPEAGHLDFLEKDQEKWVEEVRAFLNGRP